MSAQPSKRFTSLVRGMARSWESLENIVPWERLKNAEVPEADWPAFHQAFEVLFRQHMELQTLLAESRRLERWRLLGIGDDDLKLFKMVVEPREPLLDDLLLYAYWPSYDLLIGQLREFRSSVTTASPSAWVRRTLWAAVERLDDSLDGDDPRREETFDFDGAAELLDWPLFKPDQWLQNRGRIRPLVLGKKVVHLPERVTALLDEARAAYVFGLWRAVQALARAVIEHAVKDRVPEACAERDLALMQVLNKVVQLRPELGQENLHYIREAANAVLHGRLPRDATLVDYEPSADTARSSLLGAIRLCELLYR